VLSPQEDRFGALYMKTYCVGGAVRDSLLGLPVKDKDYVVVGTTSKAMLDAGFKPVGKDFPVFLHPKSHEEYALARTERKTAKGYRGFEVHATPDVTLEEDLSRRDFTMNAIAQANDASLIDPYNGQADIHAKIIRHVSPAFTEDPVRILRAARFSARFTDFTIAEETKALMAKMVALGEVDALVPERVWQELSRGLMEAKPSRMFDVLRDCGALKIIMPELDRLWGVPQPEQHHPEIDTGIHVMMVIDYAAKHNFTLPVRFAALTHDLGKGTTPKDILPRHIGHEERSVQLLMNISKRLKIPNDCKELAKMVAKFHGKLHSVSKMRPDTLLKFLIELDAIRQPERFEDFLRACECDSRGRTGLENCPLPETEIISRALRSVLSLDAGAIAKNMTSPEKIKEAIFEARLDLLTVELS
jgi:tRNA nucleotidyltransferase (CCA-adding enzyme)